ncbi:serine/threonine-protein kinase AtPK2/AtPK19-like [Populus alba]|uniref:serine/threonine-protein kinase AtPK2/AtPK19-like n=1 Tax=Populus alba TaxID=43335 RepID=UPI003CC769E7
MCRDLKPENILLEADGQVMLTDFGLAKQSSETVLAKGHDKATDWWSVGILLYEMLTGKPPFTGGNGQKSKRKIMKDKIKLPAFLSSEEHSLSKGDGVLSSH